MMSIRPQYKSQERVAPLAAGTVARVFSPLRASGDASARLFSVCLYREPTYAERFPLRDFNKRYLSQRDAITRFCESASARLLIFCDEDMAATALAFPSAEVYLVERTEAFAFSQHVWRYYSTLLPGAASGFHHFRGLDNVAADNLASIGQFEHSEADLLHAPYFPFKKEMKTYVPVRGSCSVARRGVGALARWLTSRPVKEPLGPWPRGFHCDEMYLKQFFYAELGNLNLDTLIDRDIPNNCWKDMMACLQGGATLTARGSFRKTRFLRSS
jgi:hypothetical protein